MQAMALPQASRAPHWYGLPVRVLLLTILGTLLSFAISLFLAIIGTMVVAAVRGTHPDMRLSYLQIALPMALVAGSIIFVLAVALEVRHYRQMKALSGIERVS